MVRGDIMSKGCPPRPALPCQQPCASSPVGLKDAGVAPATQAEPAAVREEEPASDGPAPSYQGNYY